MKIKVEATNGMPYGDAEENEYSTVGERSGSCRSLHENLDLSFQATPVPEGAS
jgi:hypothetical protein